MLDVIKKIAFTGIGLAFLTKEKLEELSKEIIEKGKLSEQEGKDFIAELKKKSEQAKNDLETQLDDMVNKTIQKMNLVTRDDLTRLEERINELSEILKEKEANN